MPSPSRPAPDGPPQSSFAEIRPCADPNDAGTEWRATRLRDLAWRARCLGVHDAPEIQSALLAMREATAELDAMAVAQSSPSYHRPWWADGEYDEARAEAANDLGVASFRARDWSAAFDHHTEAIRLEPRRAVYHANRAAAALKLGRHRCALDDADAAVERDPTHVQALARAGVAAAALRKPDVALLRFRAVLARKPDHPIALRGRARALAHLAETNRRDANAREAARRGERPPLPEPDDWPSLDRAAADALDAEAVFAANPRYPPAAVAAAEAAILCGRLERALEVCDETETKTKTVEMAREEPPTARATTAFDSADDADLAYARAEATWRTGLDGVSRACASLRAFADRRAGAGPVPRKMIALGARLERLRELTAMGDAAANDGRSEAAERAFDAALRLSVLRPPAAWTRPREGTEGAEGADDADPGRVEGADRVRARGGARARDREPYPNRTRGDLLRRRASARLDRVKYGVVDEPGDASRTRTRANVEADLDECVAICPSDVDARRLRAEVRDSRGDLEGAFADLRAAFEAAPENAELDAATRDAARAALGRRREDASSPGTGTKTGTGKIGGALYRALGVSADADARGIRTGYRRAAARWHPDKWAGFGEAERRDAAAAFERVAEAYETLGDPARRRAYDADPRRRDEEDAARR